MFEDQSKNELEAEAGCLPCRNETQPATGEIPALTFVPNAHDPKTGKLKGSLLVMPHLESQLPNWPENIRALAAKGVTLHFALDPDASPAGSQSSVTVTPRFDTCCSRTAEADALWEMVIHPPSQGLVSAERQALIDEIERVQGSGGPDIGIADPAHTGFYRNASGIVEQFKGWFDVKRLEGSTRPIFRKAERFKIAIAEAAARGPDAVAEISTPHHVANQNLMNLESALTTYDALRFLDALSLPQTSFAGLAAASSHATRVIASAKPFHKWLGLPQLFENRLVSTKLPLREPGAFTMAQNDLNLVLYSVAQRGIAAGAFASEQRNNKLNSLTKRDTRDTAERPGEPQSARNNPPHAFHRETSDPGPETRVSSALAELIAAIRRGQEFDPTAPRIQMTSLVRSGRHPIEGAVTSVLNPRKSLVPQKVNLAELHDRLNQGKDMLSKSAPAFQSALAQHIVSMRPEPPISAPYVAVHERQLAPAEIHFLLREMDDVWMRRLFGLLAFPPLARVMKLVLDVEFDVAALPQKVRDRIATPQGHASFFVGAAFGNPGQPEYWTACELSPFINVRPKSRRLFTIADEESMGAVAPLPVVTPLAPIDVLTSTGGTDEPLDQSLVQDPLAPASGPEPVAALPADPPESRAKNFTHGTLNLAQNIGGEPRYGLTSLDVIARAEQLINSAEADASATSTGVDAQEGEGPSRTIGIALNDLFRDEAVRSSIAAKQREALALQKGTARKRYAKDLVTGFRVDVAVQARGKTCQSEGNSWTWRSLSGRVLKFRPVKPPQKGSTEINVERLINEELRACLGGNASDDAVRAWRRALEETSARAPNKLVNDTITYAGEESTDAEIVALDTLFQWEGDPLGAPCTAGLDLSDSDECIETGVDLAISHTLDLPGAEAKGTLPPRLEIARNYRFGLRSAHAAGGALSVEEARHIYDEGTAFPESTEGYVFRRHERVAAPAIAGLHPLPKVRPGDSLKSLVVRSKRESGLITTSARRIVYVPAMPMSAAAAHPNVDGCELGRQRVLDGLPLVDGRPGGGLAFAMLDPATGGLPVQTKAGPRFPTNLKYVNLNDKPKGDREHQDGVFRVERSPRAAYKQRKAHYYPDPAATTLNFQIWTHGDNPLPLTPEAIVIPVYDKEIMTRVPDRLKGPNSVPSLYPFAMPVVIEVEAVDAFPSPQESLADRLLFKKEEDTGYIDDDGDFRPLRKRQDPPEPSVTVRRVRVRLYKGDDFDLRCWCGVPEERVGWFAIQEKTQRILDEAQLLLPEPLTRLIAKRLEKAPLPEQSEVTSCRVVHAVDKPRDATWAPADPDQPSKAEPALLRRTIVQERWPAWVEEAPSHAHASSWNALHELGASMTWIGGSLAIDRRLADTVTLEIRAHDVRDEPGVKLPIRKDGEFDFPWLDPESVNLQPYPLPVPPGHPMPTDLIAESLKSRGLAVLLKDSRAHRLRIRTKSLSRFSHCFEPGHPDKSSSTSDAIEVWAPATRRPDAMSEVELLPAFVWTEGHNFAVRRMFVRLMWRRPKALGVSEPGKGQATGCWFSSGEEEKFCLLLRRDGELPGKLGPLEDYVTQWGADPIRQTAIRPPWAMPRSVFASNNHATRVTNAFVPLPAKSDEDDDAAALHSRFTNDNDAAARVMDLLTFDPQYDEVDDLWYVDVDIDPRDGFGRDLGGPMMRLGIARYQAHAMASQTEARRNLCVSRPDKIGFRLEPRRKLTVRALPRDKVTKYWPIEILVEGPNAVVKGVGESFTNQDLKAKVESLSRPKFRARVLRSRVTVFDHIDSSGDEIVAEVTSDGMAPPEGEELFRTIIHVKRNPARTPHFVFIEEMDLMLSAHGDRLEESGPRFMAKVPVRRG